MPQQNTETWNANTETVLPIVDMGYEVIAATSNLVDTVQEVAGIEWDHSGGQGGYVGLAEEVETVIGPVFPKCSKAGDCRMAVQLTGVVEGQPAEYTSLVLACAGKVFGSEEAATAEEAECASHHQVAATEFGPWAVKNTVALATAREGITAAQALETAALKPFQA